MSFVKNNMQSLACFIFFSLLLSLRSGYGLAALLSLLIAFFSFKEIVWERLSKKEIFFSFSLFLFCFFWGLSFDSAIGLNEFNEAGIKYFFACFVFISAIFVSVKKRFYVAGLVVGCFAAFFIAVYQYKSIGRAEGFTNAIRFGNLALWMACACLIFSYFCEWSKLNKLLLTLIALLGIVASLLSLSRGGWLFIFILPFVGLCFFEENKNKIKIALLTLAAAFVLGLLAMNVNFIEKRVAEARNEVTSYIEKIPGSAETSVGARLEQWKLAWAMGWEKPLLGWGEKGYLVGREEYVEKGLADPSVVKFGHAHNEFLNSWAKKGAVGIIGLLLVYAAPLILFWPQKKYLKEKKSKEVGVYKAVSLIGISIPLGYFVFGLTEYFFYLNVGHIFYIFSIIYTYSLLKSTERKIDAQ